MTGTNLFAGPTEWLEDKVRCEIKLMRIAGILNRLSSF